MALPYILHLSFFLYLTLLSPFTSVAATPFCQFIPAFVLLIHPLFVVLFLSLRRLCSLSASTTWKARNDRPNRHLLGARLLSRANLTLLRLLSSSPNADGRRLPFVGRPKPLVQDTRKSVISCRNTTGEGEPKGGNNRKRRTGENNDRKGRRETIKAQEKGSDDPALPTAAAAASQSGCATTGESTTSAGAAASLPPPAASCSSGSKPHSRLRRGTRRSARS